MDQICVRHATVEDAPYLARILIETNQHTFCGLVPDMCLVSLTRKESTENWRRTLDGGLEGGQFLLIAEEAEGTIIGFALAGSKIEREDERELNVLMVDIPWQRQGIGRLLVSQVAKELKKQLVRSLMVGVQCNNPNRIFYERLGAKQTGFKPLNWAGYETEEILFRWEDLDELIQEENND